MEVPLWILRNTLLKLFTLSCQIYYSRKIQEPIKTISVVYNICKNYLFSSKIRLLEFSICCHQTYIVPTNHMTSILFRKNGIQNEEEEIEERKGEDAGRRRGRRRCRDEERGLSKISFWCHLFFNIKTQFGVICQQIPKNVTLFFISEEKFTTAIDRLPSTEHASL